MYIYIDNIYIYIYIYLYIYIYAIYAIYLSGSPGFLWEVPEVHCHRSLRALHCAAALCQGRLGSGAMAIPGGASRRVFWATEISGKWDEIHGETIVKIGKNHENYGETMGN